MLRIAGAALIRFYQRQLSPRKGYRCAYGVLHGTGTCSSIGLQIMEQQGFWAFWRKMPLQFEACRAAAINLDEDREARKRRARPNRNVSASDCMACGSNSGPCDAYDIALCEGAGACMESDGFEIGACDFFD